MSVEREIGDLIRAIAHEKKENVCAAVVTSVEGNTCNVERVSDGRELEKVSLNSSSNEKDSLIITPVKNSQVLIASINEYDWFVCQYSQIEKVTLNTTDKIEVNAAGNIEVNGKKEIKISTIKVDDENDEKEITINAVGNIKINGEKEIAINAAEKIEVKGEDKITIDAADIIEINSGKNGGLVLSEKVKSELDTIIQRVNDIVTALNKMAAAATSTASAPVLGTALGTLISGNISNILTPLVKPQKTVFENNKVTH